MPLKNEQQIREQIFLIERSNGHVLKGDFAEVFVNAPRALMQQAAKTALENLYWVLGEACPEYPYEKNKPEKPRKAKDE